MTSGRPRNLPASIRQRLYNLSRDRHQDFGLVLNQYAIERLLVRLCQSPYAQQFTLKGAQLIAQWMETPYRPTRDLDLLHEGASDAEALATILREVSSRRSSPEDGISFLADSVRAEVIREDTVYEGVRLGLQYKLGSITDALQIDIGVGDTVTPRPDLVSLPSMLGFPSVQMRAYPRETVIAEKLEAMVTLGIRNSRMKDFYDVWTLSGSFAFKGRVLSEAIGATFRRRRTEIPPSLPLALSSEFWQDEAKQAQWRAFVRRVGLEGEPPNLERVILELQTFLGPVLEALAANQGYLQDWTAAEGWRVTSPDPENETST